MQGFTPPGPGFAQAGSDKDGFGFDGEIKAATQSGGPETDQSADAQFGFGAPRELAVGGSDTGEDNNDVLEM